MRLLAALGFGGKQLSRGNRATALGNAADTLAENHKAGGKMTVREAIAAALEAQGLWTEGNENELYNSVGEAVGVKPDAVETWEKEAAFEKKHKAIEKAIQFV
ncbi:hypothetical protein HY414_00680 [Candidatus Kaiserbacteria bacterium]|nr:hypothetical protein [Candidatus Kaiserbacteria bacterium]